MILRILDSGTAWPALSTTQLELATSTTSATKEPWSNSSVVQVTLDTIQAVWLKITVVAALLASLAP